MYIFVYYMQSSDKNLKTFISNIAQGIKNHQIDELNDAIVEVMNGKGCKSKEVDFILTTITTDYGISIRTLKKARGVDNIKEARQIVYCLLYFDLKLSIRYISSTIFGHKNHRMTWRSINNFNTLNLKVKTDRQFKSSYDTYQIRLNEFITNQED